MNRKIITVMLLCVTPVLLKAQVINVLKKATSENNKEAIKKATTAATLSDADIMEYTREAVQWMDENNPVADPKTDKYGMRLQKLVSGLDNYDGLNLNYKVYLVRDVNAFATADGSVRVFAGLMDIMEDDQLMSVIGHEIGHVKNEHSKKQMKKR